MKLSEKDLTKIIQLEQLLERIDSNDWRYTVRRESAEEVANAIRSNGGFGVALCSMAVVNTPHVPTEKNVICWMGPASGSYGDDINEAQFLAEAKSNIQWLISKLREATNS